MKIFFVKYIQVFSTNINAFVNDVVVVAVEATSVSLFSQPLATECIQGQRDKHNI